MPVDRALAVTAQAMFNSNQQSEASQILCLNDAIRFTQGAEEAVRGGTLKPFQVRPTSAFATCQRQLQQV